MFNEADEFVTMKGSWKTRWFHNNSELDVFLNLQERKEFPQDNVY